MLDVHDRRPVVLSADDAKVWAASPSVGAVEKYQPALGGLR
jgi:putative SOS response-associated peptidase YedK